MGQGRRGPPALHPTPGQVKGMLGRLAAGGRTTLLCVLGRPLDRPGRTAINLPGLLPGSMFGRVRHTVPSFSACQHDCRPEAALSTLATEVSLYHHFTLVLLDRQWQGFFRTGVDDG